MPQRTPRPKTKLKDKARLSVAIMERVGAMMRKTPIKDLNTACRIMQEERDAFMADDPKYTQERRQAGKDNAVAFILASIAANATQRILDHEEAQAKAALVNDLMKPIEAAEPIPFPPQT
jgi:hypothetical protein